MLVVQTHEPLAGFAAFALIALGGLVVDSVRETVGLLLGRVDATETVPARTLAGVAELVDAAGLGPVGLRPLEVRVLSPAWFARRSEIP